MDLSSSKNITPELIDSLMEQIQLCFRQVRPLVLERAGSVSFTAKQDGSPVTVTDSEIENIIFEFIKARFPGMPIFGEESGYDNNLPEVCLLIDPIDGTPSFIKNIPAFTAMAVLIVEGASLASVIYNYSTDEMFVAQKGKGAFKNDVVLNLKGKTLPKIAFCKGRHITPLNSILNQKNIICEIAPSGGGYGFNAIAEGSVAARFQLHSRGYIHDYAPGALLVSEAGGVIIPIKEDTYTYKTTSFVACHPELENTIRENLQAIRDLEI